MPKIVDHDQYRKELLSKSFNLFAEKGYAAITMRQIAQGLGVSTGTLYHYFPSKEALFEQLVEEMAQRDILQVALELENAQTLRDRLERAFDFVVRNHDYFFKQMLIFADFYQHQSREPDRESDMLPRVCQRVKQAISELLGITDPDVLDFVFVFVDGLCISRIYGHEMSRLSAKTDLLIEMLIPYLEKQVTNSPSRMSRQASNNAVL